MANAAKMTGHEPLRVLVLGYPGAGKTGGLACLVTAGYKLRVLDFDGNIKPLLQFSDAKQLANVDVVTLEDRLTLGPDVIETKGVPTAFQRACKLLDAWKYQEDGVDVDLGASRDWGPDTIVVIDSLTSLGEVCMNRALSIAGRTTKNMRDADWGVAMKFQEKLLDMLRAKSNRFHVIVLSHLKVISPREVRQGDDALTTGVKHKLADMIAPRIYPSALGRDLPPRIAGKFDTVLLCERQVKPGSKVAKRVLRTDVGEELDVKVPSVNLPPVLDLSTGLLQLFTELVPWSLPKPHLENAV